MKKFIYSIVLLLLVVFPTQVLAEGYFSASPGSLTIEQGSTKTFTITAFNAIGDATIKSENSGIASVSISEWGTGMVGENETKTGTITVTGKSVGTTKIVISIDAATFDGTDLSGQTKTITVKVVEKQAPAPQPSQPQVVLSSNNNLSSLSVEGYELVKADNNNYTLIVSNDVINVKVNATAEDPKAKVEGTGTKELKVGENTFEIIITAENGAQNKVYIKVNRKDGYYLEDLDSLLKKQDVKEADIILKEDSKITKDNISKIKENNKDIKFNYYDQNKKLLYSWSVYGNKVRESNEFDTSITFPKEKVKEIYKISNYADGLYVNFKHDGKLPEGTRVKLYVGDKFENDSIVSVHRYNESDKKLEFIKDNLKVTDGYIEFDIDHCSDYFVTMSNISNIGEVINSSNSSINIFMIIAIIELIVIIGLILIYTLKIKQNINKNKDNKQEVINTIENDNILNSNLVDISNKED